MEGDPPLVAPFSPYHWGAKTVWLPGDEPANPISWKTPPPVEPVGSQTCNACATDMPYSALCSFDDNGDEFFFCLDTTACMARVKGASGKVESKSFIMQAVNTLTKRVAELEQWRTAMGNAVAVVDEVPASTEAGTAPDRVAQLIEEYATPDGWAAEPGTTALVMSRVGEVGSTLVKADARHVPMDNNSVDLIVTSPPYWAQRSYTDGGEHYAGQIGDEPTYQQFLDNLIACTRDWMRVLKPSGSIWVNLGDKYTTSSSGDSNISKTQNAARTKLPPVSGMKPKSLLGLPWRYALRCIDELGLILREEIIWSKPNGMPESITDRCRRSHEQWFHFTLNPTYYSAVDRIRLQDTPGSPKRGVNASVNPDRPGDTDKEVLPTNPFGALPPSVWSIATAGLIVPPELGVDHYAAYPMELPRRIIQGFSPQAVCTVCGEGRRPAKTVSREGGRIRQKLDNRFLGKPNPYGMTPSSSQDAIGSHTGYKTWHSISGEVCACTPHTDHAGVQVGVGAHSGDASIARWREYHLADWEPPPTTPGIVLDPFGGTGTTVLVAEMHGRHGVHLDLSADYMKIAEWRTADPGQRAHALQVPKPPVQLAGQLDMMDILNEGNP